MNLTLDDIRAFLVIAELQSFSQAAERLAVSQSALTRRIQKIEDHLGARLFDRSTRRVDLTAVGREFTPLAHRMLGEFERSLGQIGDVIQKRRGVVTVASLMTVAFGLLPLVAERFNAAHPDVRLRILDATGPEILDHVRSGDAEFGIDMESEPDSEIAFEPLAVEHYVLACRPDHPLAGTGPLRWSALRGHRCVVLGPDSGIGRQLRAAVPALDWQFEMQHLSTLMGFLAAGMRVAAIPALALTSMQPADLMSRPLVDPDVKRRIGIIRRRGAALSPAAQSLRELVTAAFRDFRNAAESRQ
jgi:DNA-binding transcriptional LysR family regulator